MWKQRRDAALRLRRHVIVELRLPALLVNGVKRLDLNGLLRLTPRDRVIANVQTGDRRNRPNGRKTHLF